MILALRSPNFFSPSLAGFLFESHYLWWLALLVLGGVVLLVAYKRLDKRLTRAGVGVVALTLLWALAAFLIETPAERLYAAHVGLAKAAEKHDVDAIVGYCDPQFALKFTEISPNIDEAKKQIKGYMDSLNIKDTTFTRYDITLNPDGTAVTNFVAITRTDGGALQTTWRIIWADLPDQDWRIRSADGHLTQQ